MLLALMIATGAFTAYTMNQPESTMNGQAIALKDDGKLAPNFDLETIDGKKLSLSDYKGKAVILNFWATWCPPCRAEIPDMIELQEEYGGENFTFIGVAVGDQLERVKRFVENSGINYPVAMGNNAITDDYGRFIEGGMRGIPTTFVISTKGEILGHFVGARSKEAFEAAIKDALKK
ncbi:TlpA family protein disulfide reductase [Chloroherpeton thalassium]|uniref:TlpA family protein disulfide reductase n=1 Tax=Chloroherpeton thalassium TaxID=100716 RepID=UPI000313F4C1|nr:TlpA disulfide reductase family protein [Chloroherpeton thalassium]